MINSVKGFWQIQKYAKSTFISFYSTSYFINKLNNGTRSWMIRYKSKLFRISLLSM